MCRVGKFQTTTGHKLLRKGEFVRIMMCIFITYVLFHTLILGIDQQLARHYAHLFIRDPLFLFREHIYEDDEQTTNHFEVSSRSSI